MRRVLIGLVVFLLLVGSLLPAVAEAVPSSECVRLTQEAVGESLGKDTPGAALTVFENGTRLVFEGFGYADIKSRALITPDTVFPIGELSGVFVPLVAMTLSEEGTVQLDADIATVLPADFSKKLSLTYPVTLRQLLLGRAGFGGRTFDIQYKKAAYGYDSLSDTLLSDVPTQILPPDTVSMPSLFGTALAAYVLECATGERYEDLLNTCVLGPLSMTKTGFEEPTDEAMTVTGYTAADKGQFSGVEKTFPALYPANGMYSNLADLSQLLSYFLAGHGAPLCSDAAFAALMEVTRCGVFREGNMVFRAGELSFFAGGTASGSGVSFTFSPSTGRGALVLTNAAGSALLSLGETLCGGRARVFATSAEELYDLKLFKGVYGSGSGEIRTFVGRLETIKNSQKISVGDDACLHFGGKRLRQIAPGVFADADAPDGGNVAVLQFLFDGEGKPVAAVTAEGQCFVPLKFYYEHLPGTILFGTLVVLAVFFLLSGAAAVFRRRMLRRDGEPGEDLRFLLPGVLSMVLSVFVLIEAAVGWYVGAGVLSSFYYAFAVLTLLLGTAATVAYLIAFVSTILDRKLHSRLAGTAFLFVAFVLLVYFFGLSAY